MTELIFEHALRIRMKAQEPPAISISTPTTAAGTPDNASGGDENMPGSSTTIADETNVASSSTKGKGMSPPVENKKPDEDSGNSTENLTGKLNNLVSTDIQNVVEGRDFPFLRERKYIFVPFQLLISCSFQCAADDWCWGMVVIHHSRLEVSFFYFTLISMTLQNRSALAGMAVMVMAIPLPGYIAKLTQTTQIERMKKVSPRRFRYRICGSVLF